MLKYLYKGYLTAMLFNSWEYLLFFPIVCLLYFYLPKSLKNWMLLAASYFFYSCWSAKYALLMLLSTAITFVSGILIGNEDKKEHPSVKKKRMWVAFSFTLNLAILFFFKYYGFFAGELQSVFDSLEISLHLPDFKVLLPVGISFYTFQALSYTADVYRKDLAPTTNFAKYALFVSFFPQLVAGPIERSKNLLSQFDEAHSFDYELARSGFLRILRGMVKKVLIADRLAILVDAVYSSPVDHNGIGYFFATFFFAFQIYCDFSGYSDIAIGSARMMGFSLMENFRTPYFSRSIGEFWRRWHISLSSWFKDYLYLPLGGSHVSRARWAFNIMTVFMVSGLWHGANWTFIVWGALHGIYQVIGKLTKKKRANAYRALHIDPDGKLRALISTFITFALVCFSWIFFRADSLGDALYIVSNLFNFSGSFSLYAIGMDVLDFVFGIILIVLLTLYDWAGQHIDTEKWLKNRCLPVRWTVYLVLIFALILFGIYGDLSAASFIYFQF